MVLTAGQPVRWQRHGIVTRIRSIECVKRGVFGDVECAVLECNRFVPLSELVAIEVERSTNGSDIRESPTAGQVERKSLKTVETQVVEATLCSPLLPRREERDSDRRLLTSDSQEDEPWFGKRTAANPPSKASNHPSSSQKAPASSQKAPASSQKAPASSQKTPASSVPEVPCEVLAIDFMNVLVRAFHAGKPTENHAVRSMFQTIASAVRQLRPAKIVFAFEAGHDHRSKLLPEYKAHRPEQAPELRSQIELAKRAIEFSGLAAFRVPGWEADDVLASIVERFPCVVICSCDKDLLSLHGRARIFHPWAGGGFVDPETKLGIPAGQVTDFLSLCGDSSDGIPGVKGIGPKTAVQLLNDFESLEGILVAAMSGRIPGAIGTKLKEQRSQALLCQQVVQLRSSLPLPELPAWSPPAGWQLALQSIGLGSVAAILDGLRPHFGSNTPMEGLPASASTAEEEPGGRQKVSDAGRGVGAATEPVQLSQDDGQSEAVSSARQPANSSEDSLRTADRDSAGRSDTWLQQQYEQGKKYAQYARNGREVENPWKRDSAEFMAWDQGFRGVTFDLSGLGGLF